MNRTADKRVLLIAGVALALRLIMVAVFPGPDYYSGITGGYLDVVHNVLDGKGFTVFVDLAPIASGTPQWAYVPFIDRPLGYVLLMLIPSVVSASPVLVQILQALLGALSAVLLFRIGSMLVSETTAFRAALVYAVWPLSARFEITLLPDAVMPFFLLLIVWLTMKAWRSDRSVRWALAAGLAFGTGLMMRPDILFLPIFLLAGLALQRLDRAVLLKATASFIVGAAIVLGLQTGRNYRVTDGAILPLGLGNGISMWEGISQFGDTLGTVYGDVRMTEREGYRSWAYPNGIARDRKRFTEALQIIRAHPAWYATVMARRIPVLVTPDWIMTRRYALSLKDYLDETPGGTVISFVREHPIAAGIRGLLILLQYGSLILTVMVLLRRRWDRWVWIPGLIIFYYVAVHIPTNAEPRYFYPVIPLVLLLAVQAIDDLRTRRQKV